MTIAFENFFDNVSIDEEGEIEIYDRATVFLYFLFSICRCCQPFIRKYLTFHSIKLISRTMNSYLFRQFRADQITLVEAYKYNTSIEKNR